MLFTEPIPFKEALESKKVKALLPTTLSSKELHEIAPEIRERALFSARTANAYYLQQVDTVLESLLNPKQVEREGEDQTVTEGDNLATARVKLKEALDSISYKAGEGEEGTIKDLRSDQRLNLVLQTNANMAAGYGQWAQMQDEDILDEFPAQELYRAEGRKVPREWLDRWEESGGELFDGRMIALVNDPIWEALGDYDDGLGNPYPPFAFNSGMDVRPIDRAEAEELGLIKPNEKVVPEDRGFDELLEAKPDVKSEQLKAALLDTMPGYTFDGDVLTKANEENFDEAQHPRDAAGKFTNSQIDAAQEKLKALPQAKYEEEVRNVFPKGPDLDRRVALTHQSEVKQVKLSELHSPQGEVVRHNVQGILERLRPAHIAQGSEADQVSMRIEVQKKDGKLIISDGNHRATAALLAGADTIEANVIDLDKKNLANADDCGTGFGGFKPGNTCGGKGSSYQEPELSASAQKFREGDHIPATLNGIPIKAHSSIEYSSIKNEQLNEPEIKQPKKQAPVEPHFSHDNPFAEANRADIAKIKALGKAGDGKALAELPIHKSDKVEKYITDTLNFIGGGTGKGKHVSTGAIIQEADGRIWLVEPKNHFGGYNFTFPKGTVEEKDGLTLQQNAHKEIHEETGLTVKLTGHLGDYEGDTSMNRFYTAVRRSGDPRAFKPDETASVRLVSIEDAKKLLNRERDREVLAEFEKRQGQRANEESFTNEVSASGQPFRAYGLPIQAIQLLKTAIPSQDLNPDCGRPPTSRGALEQAGLSQAIDNQESQGAQDAPGAARGGQDTDPWGGRPGNGLPQTLANQGDDLTRRRRMTANQAPGRGSVSDSVAKVRTLCLEIGQWVRRIPSALYKAVRGASQKAKRRAGDGR